MDKLSKQKDLQKNQPIFDSKIAEDWEQPDADEFLEPESYKQQKNQSKNIFPVEHEKEGMFESFIKDMQEVTHTDIERLREQDFKAEKQAEKTSFMGKIKNILGKSKKTDGSKEDVEFIRSLREVPAETLSDLQVEDRARLEVIKYRNLSSILLNAKKVSGDSSEMKEIKKAVTDIENSMTEIKTYTPENIEELIDKYKIAIAHCKHYVKTKNPDTSFGVERKEMVENALDRLNIELSFLRHSEKLIEEGKLDTTQITDAYDLITQARVFGLKNTDDPIGDNTPEKAMGVHALTMRDFAYTISSKNRGDIYIKDGKFIKKGNNFLRGDGLGEALYMAFSGDTTATVETKQMKQRLFKLISDRMTNPEPAEYEREWLREIEKKLGVNNGESKSAPMDRKELAEIVGIGCVVAGKTRVATKRKPNADQPRAVQDDIVARGFFALSATSFLYNKDIQGKQENVLYEAEHKEKQRERYKEIIKDVKKTGISIPNIDNDMMEGLLKGTIGIVRDNVFTYLEQIYDGIRRFVSDDKLIDLTSICSPETKEGRELMTKLYGFALCDYALKSEEARSVNSKKVNDFIKETILSLSKEKGRDLSEENKASLNLSITEFNNRGADGLEEAIEAHLPKSKTWKKNPAKLKESQKLVKELCDGMRDISLLSDKAVLFGLSEEESEKLKALGSRVQTILDNNGEDVEFILSRLKDSSYNKGYKKLKKQSQKGLSVKDSSEKLSELKSKPKPDENVSEEKHEFSLGEKLEKLNDSQLMIVKVLRLEREPSALIGKAKDEFSKDLLELRRALRVFPQNVVFRKNVTLGGENVRFIQKADNRLFIRLGGQVIPLTHSAPQISDIIEEDVVANAKLYGQKYADEVINGLNVIPENQGLLVRSRNLCIKYLAGKTKKPDTYFTNLSSEEIKKYADYLMKGILKPKQVISYVEKIENNEYILGKECTELLDGLERAKSGNIKFEVKEKEPEKNERTWTKEQSSVKNFLADLVFTEDLWKLDEDSKNLRDAKRNGEEDIIEKGRSFIPLLEKHSDALLILYKKPEILVEMLDELPFSLDSKEKGGEQKTSPRETLLKSIEDFKNSPIMKKIKEEAEKEREINLGFYKLKSALGPGLAIKGAIAALKSDTEEAEEGLLKLGELKEGIEKAAEDFAESIQGVIKEAADSVFAGAEGDVLFDTVVKDPHEEGIEKEEKEKRIKAGSEVLEKVVKNSISGNEGVGLFMKTTLSNYFEKVNIKDKQNLLASAIRFAKPKPEILVKEKPEGLEGKALEDYEEEREKAEKLAQGNFLGGILKGAGPLLQKVMQGMPEEALSDNPEISEALKDMKSNLAPIPEKIVRAELQNVIARSNGKITEITDVKALGAASVGQTFFCTLKGPKLGQGKRVVVKLLRPDVRNRMLREREVMLECARITDQTVAKARGEKINGKGGMELTYEGQLLRIEEELDLTIEAKNAQRGSLYDTGFTTVKAMKVDNIVDPTGNVLILEKAKGDTVDKYTDKVKDEEKNLLSSLFKTDKEGKLIRNDDGKLIPIGLNWENIKNLNECKGKLINMAESLLKRQKYVCQLTESWVKEGIYGEGFYHGDLHAGNIMVDDDGLTVIDFGNATQLDEHQRKYVARMMMASAMGNESIFMDSFEELMGTDGSAEFKKKKPRLHEAFKRILSLGDHKDSGTRIAAAITRAQSIGVEIPAAIYNFSQSQLRLQNTIAGMNSLIENLMSDIAQIESYSGGESSLSKDSFIEAINKESDFKNLNICLNDFKAVAKGSPVENVGENTTEKELKDIEAKLFGNLAGHFEFRSRIKEFAGNIENFKDEKSSLYSTVKDFVILTHGMEGMEMIEKKTEEFLSKLRAVNEENMETSVKDLLREVNLEIQNVDGSGILKKWDDLRELISTGGEAKKDEVKALKNDIRLAFIKKNPLPNPYLENFKNSLLSEDEKVKEAVEKDVESWVNYAKESNKEMGDDLNKKFEANKDAQKNKDSYMELKLMDFLESYSKVIIPRLEKTIADRREAFSMEAPDSFVGVMAPVINSNISASISKLGWFNALWYHDQLQALQNEANRS